MSTALATPTSVRCARSCQSVQARAKITAHEREAIIGRDDTAVPFEQSLLMFDAMTGRSKTAELVTLKKEDHWLSRGEKRLQMLEASVAFLRAHNPPD